MDETPAARSKRAKRKKVIASVAGIILLIASSFFIWLFMQMHRASKAFSSFGQALVSTDYKHAYELTSSDFREAMSESAFADQQRALSSHLGALKVVKQGPSETDGNQDGWKSTISAHFVYERAERQFVFVMKETDGKWEVYGYKEQ